MVCHVPLEKLVHMRNINILTRLKCLFVLLLFALLDIGPVPITALTGMFIVFFLPRWFKQLVDRLYGEQ